MKQQFSSINSLLAKIGKVSQNSAKVSTKTDEYALQVVVEVEALKDASGRLLAEAREVHALLRGPEGELFPELLQAQLKDLGLTMSAINKAKAERVASAIYARGLGVQVRVQKEQAEKAELAKQQAIETANQHVRDVQAQQVVRSQAPTNIIKEIFAWRETNQKIFQDLGKSVNTVGEDGVALKGKERDVLIEAGVSAFLKKVLKNHVPQNFTQDEWNRVFQAVTPFMVRGAVAMRTAYYCLVHDQECPQWDEEWKRVNTDAVYHSDSKSIPVAHSQFRKGGKKARKAANGRVQFADNGDKPDGASAEDYALFGIQQ